MKVTFSATHSVFAVKAPKDTLVSLSETPTQVEDGVYKIGDNGVVLIDEQCQTDSIYLSTAGNDYTVAKGERIATVAEGVEVWAGISGISCPFAKGGKGGGGSSGGCNYKGTTTTAISNGSTTNPITIDGESYTAVFGDIVVYGYTEFVFDGTTWSEFGRPFDTTPTSGSANAVTSDGIYKRTPLARGSGSGSVVGGANTTAQGSNSFAFGQNCITRGTASVALGHNVLAQSSYGTNVGAYNVGSNSTLFEIGNGTGTARSNIVEVDSTELNVNGEIKKNGVSLPTPYTTMPNITESMLGQIAQYVGETTNDYIKGYFYIASSDGAAEPTYSWVNLPVSPRTYSETVLWENDGTTNPSTITLSSAYTNFDAIVIVHKHEEASNLYTSTSTYISSVVDIDDMLGISLGDGPNLYTWYKLTAANELTISASGLLLNKIIGIKY